MLEFSSFMGDHFTGVADKKKEEEEAKAKSEALAAERER